MDDLSHGRLPHRAGRRRSGGTQAYQLPRAVHGAGPGGAATACFGHAAAQHGRAVAISG
ncbi:hypothetical protein RSPO_c01664 [Ralstonia solanacearum Po82]|uniref:Uncharacterized protein n=1 Tax=Ralstonia solanacearum (strain Po82) TaxID=1031711 RepID=F6G1F9_RALS8|nr:hypothetical protein RSPO_c01664 [Ralstonia solanacearum Po82]